MKFINQLRTYFDTFTESTLYISGKDDRFCYVLEDIGRPPGVKIQGKTCIPAGVYRVSITRSNRWQKDMMLLSNTNDGAIEGNGVRFTGVRPHGGNDIDDTEGCPLCAFHSDHEGKVWKRASDELFDIVKEWLDAGEIVYWVITD